MTLPCQRTSAVLRTGDFLRRLASPHNGGIKGVRSYVREEARRLLRHYPHWFDMGRADCWDAAEAMRYGNADDAEEPAAPPGWTRPDWMSKPCWVDPPTGWRYGFPKLYDPANDGPMREWMVKNGYPKALADKGMPCTFTEHTEGDANG